MNSKNFIGKVSLNNHESESLLDLNRDVNPSREKYWSPLILSDSLGSLEVKLYKEGPLKNKYKSKENPEFHAEVYSEIYGEEEYLGDIKDREVIRKILDRVSDKYEMGDFSFIETLMRNFD